MDHNDKKVFQFTGSNYNNWRFRMETLLEELDLLALVQDGNELETEKSKKKDRQCKNLIVQHVHDDYLEYLKDSQSAAEMWKSLSDVFEKKGFKNQLILKKELLCLKFDGKTKLTEHFLKFDQIIRELKSAGCAMEENDIVCHLMLSMGNFFNTVITALETNLGEQLTVNFVKKKLLEESLKSTNSMQASCSSGKSSDVKDNNVAFTGAPKKPFKFTCYNCGKPGHLKRDCKFKKKFVNNKRPLSSGNKDKEMTFMSNDASADQGSSTEWVIDSGASEHMCNDQKLFCTLKNLENPVQIAVAKKNENLTATMIGDIALKSIVDGTVTNITMKDVLFVPDLTCNLFSVNKIMEKDMTTVMKGNNVTIKRNNETIAVGVKKGKLFYLNFPLDMSKSLVAESNIDNNLWHKRLGHLSKGYMEKLCTMVDGICLDNKNNNENCEVCVISKQTRVPHKNERIRAKRPLELIHSDICGPITPQTFNEKRYFISFIDDYSHFAQIKLMQNKSEAFQCFQEYVSEAETHFNLKVSRLRCDNGGEYSSNEFKRYCSNKGIKIEYTMAYTPEQNGVSERFNRTLVEKARAMITESNHEKELWGEACLAACYVINRSPTSALERKVPAELWFGHKPNISKLRVFGCVAYLHRPKQFCTKFGPKSEKYLFVGYCPNGYRLYDPVGRDIVTGRDVVFFEDKFSIQDSQSDPNPEKDHQEIEQDSPEIQDESSNDTNSNERPKRNVKPPIWSYDYETYTSCALITEEIPNTAEEAYSMPDSEKWKSAMKEELKSHEEHNTWSVVQRPPDKKIIDSKWVFRIKENEGDQGNSKRHKARLVAKGYMTDQYAETYAPVAKLNTVRILLSVANQKDMHIHQMDVKTAFLNGTLDSEVYMNLPEDMYEENLVCKLNKSIYGLKESPRQWNKVFNDHILSLGFKQCKSDYCLYVNTSNKEIIYLLLYVDDLLIVSENLCLVNEVKSALLERFQMQDMGSISNFLGLDITRSNDELHISQSKYLGKLVQKFGLENCNPVKTPMEVKGNEITQDEENNNCFDKPYRLLLGSLMYAMLGSRPDLSFALNYLSRFQITQMKLYGKC